MSDLRLRRVIPSLWPAGFHVADLATGARVRLTRCEAHAVFPGAIGILLENIQPAALQLVNCYAEAQGGGGDAGIELRNADGVSIKRSKISGSFDMLVGILVDANSSDNTFRGNQFIANVTDVVDQGTNNCWRGNRNPNGDPLTGNPSDAACP